MTRTIVDISVPLENTIYADPRGHGPTIEYRAHAQTIDELASFFPGLTREQLPGGEGWAVEHVRLSTHNGTHLDAPYHFASTMNGGERAWTIDEVPLDWCFGPGVKLDFRHFPDGYVVAPADIERELSRIEHVLAAGDIVVINTSAGKKYGSPEYVDSGCGVGRDATLYLLEHGTRVTGTDGWSWDAPFSETRKRWLREQRPEIIWEGHRAGIEIGYCHIEKLHNLEALPSTGFEIVCLPVKVKGGSAGWTRAVALLDTVIGS
jgi:kynurenine formamidase